MTLKMLVLILAALGLVVVVLTRVRLSKEGDVAGLAKVSPAMLNLHTLSGLVGEALWILYLLGAGILGDSRALVGIVGLGLLWITTLCGLAILARWLPSHGRHSALAQDDEWAEGPGLSAIAHVGMFIGVAIFTAVYVLDKV